MTHDPLNPDPIEEMIKEINEINKRTEEIRRKNNNNLDKDRFRKKPIEKNLDKKEERTR